MFRAYDKEGKQMVYRDLETFAMFGCPFVPMQEAIKDGTIMAWTGLRDKDSVRIYEGDIIFAKMMSISPIGTYVKVVFDKGSFQVEDKKGDRCWNDYLIMINGEVIGNVYENPELYEENK